MGARPVAALIFALSATALSAGIILKEWRSADYGAVEPSTAPKEFRFTLSETQHGDACFGSGYIQDKASLTSIK